MPDPRFAETVIYICRHDANGAFGVVLNRHLGLMPLAKLFESFGLKRAQEAKGSLEVRRGGPVEVSRAYILHTDDMDSALPVCQGDGVAVSGGTDVVQAIGEGRGPEQSVLFLGYSGWGPGQLDGEVAQGGWDIVPADRETLFDTDLDTLWRRARERRGLDL